METGINPTVSALARLNNTVQVSTVQSVASMHTKFAGFRPEWYKVAAQDKGPLWEGASWMQAS